MKEFVMTSPHVMPHPIVSQITNANPRTNEIATRHSQANETSQHVKTHHERHIFIPVDQTIKK